MIDEPAEDKLAAVVKAASDMSSKALDSGATAEFITEYRARIKATEARFAERLEKDLRSQEALTILARQHWQEAQDKLAAIEVRLNGILSDDTRGINDSLTELVSQLDKARLRNARLAHALQSAEKSFERNYWSIRKFIDENVHDWLRGDEWSVYALSHAEACRKILAATDDLQWFREQTKGALQRDTQLLREVDDALAAMYITHGQQDFTNRIDAIRWMIQRRLAQEAS